MSNVPKIPPRYRMVVRLNGQQVETFELENGRHGRFPYESDGWSHMSYPFGALVDAVLEEDLLSPPRPELEAELIHIESGEVLVRFWAGENPE